MTSETKGEPYLVEPKPGNTLMWIGVFNHTENGRIRSDSVYYILNELFAPDVVVHMVRNNLSTKAHDALDFVKGILPAFSEKFKRVDDPSYNFAIMMVLVGFPSLVVPTVIKNQVMAAATDQKFLRKVMNGQPTEEFRSPPVLWAVMKFIKLNQALVNRCSDVKWLSQINLMYEMYMNMIILHRFIGEARTLKYEAIEVFTPSKSHRWRKKISIYHLFLLMGETPWSKYMGVPKIYFLVGKPTSKRYKGQHLRFKSLDDGKDRHFDLGQLKYMGSLETEDFKRAKFTEIFEKWKTDDSKKNPGEADLNETRQKRVSFIQKELTKYPRPDLPLLRASLSDNIIKEILKRFSLSENTGLGYTEYFNYENLPYEFGSQRGNIPLFSDVKRYFINEITVQDFKIPAVTEYYITERDIIEESVSKYRQRLTMSSESMKPLFDDQKETRYVPRIVESDNPALTYFRLKDGPIHPYFRLKDKAWEGEVRRLLGFMPSMITNMIVRYIFLD